MGILSEIDMMNRDAEDDAFEVSSDSETVDSFSEEFEPVEPPKQEPQAEDAEEARKKAEFDAAEAKRKAEWEAKQAHKKLREQQELDRLAAMSDDDVMQASMNRVSQDTERLTRRNMKLCVMEDVQTEYIKKCRDEQTKRAFREVYENLAEKANLTSKKLQIVCPKQTDDLIAEGQALHHCVGTYIERVAAKKCLIVFVRRVEEPKKPYVTVEVRDGKIEQIHGDHNSDPTEEVKKFVDLWSRKVLPMALRTA